MNQLNSLILEGNLVRKPEVVKFTDGQVSKFTIGVNRQFGSKGEKKSEVSFIDCEAFGNLAKIIENKEKGQPVRIVGRLKQKTWEDAEHKKHSAVVVIPEHIEFRPLQKKVEVQKSQAKTKENDYSMEM